MSNNQLVGDILEELYDLARWEGSETGDLCFSLIELWDGNVFYASKEFQEALDKEMLGIYSTLKQDKKNEDRETELVKEIFGPATRISMKINDLTFDVTLKREVNNRDHKDMALALKEVVAMLEAEEVEDPDIF